MSRPITFSQACARYVHRVTAQHWPSHVNNFEAPFKVENGIPQFHSPQYLDDREWYERTLFPGESELAGRDHCHSSQQTWPYGQWLSAPYNPRVRPPFAPHYYALLLVNSQGPVTAKQIQHELRDQMPDCNTDGKAVLAAAQAIVFLAEHKLVEIEEDGTFSPIALPYQREQSTR